MRKPKTLSEAINQNLKPLKSVYSSSISKAESEAIKRASKEHGENIAVRMNSNYKMEYYNTVTGEIVSCHI